jgi:Flp pilus assembly pilin Flp
MFRQLASALRRDEGQDLIEYGLLGAFISIVAVVTLQAIGPLVDALYVAIETAITP